MAKGIVYILTKRLKEARDYLNNAMQKMKQEEKNFENKTVTMASHYNG